MEDDHWCASDATNKDGKNGTDTSDEVHAEPEKTIGSVGIRRHSNQNEPSILSTVTAIIFSAVTKIILMTDLECPLNVFVIRKEFEREGL